MRQIWFMLLFTTCNLIRHSADGQLGKLLKEKARSFATNDGFEKLKDLASEKLNAARNNFDSPSFNYAISLNDNSGLYDIKEKGELFLKAYTNLSHSEVCYFA